MVSVGIDVSKGKSTVCMIKPYGEIIVGPMEVTHIESELKDLVKVINGLNDDVKVVMEATGIYHLPVLTYLKESRLFVSVINPYQMKQYRSQGLRKVKTDKADSIAIANYGIEHWYALKDFVASEDKYNELSILSRQYRHYMRLHVASLQELTHVLDYAMPGIKNQFNSWNPENGKDKLADFVEKYWHYDNICKKSERQFVESYLNWARKKGYHPNQNKAAKIYSMAKDGIPTLPADQTTKMLVIQAVEVLRRVDETLSTILSRMQEIAKTLPEYSVVRSMGGVGDILAPKLIADIGDVRRFHNSKALIAYAGIDPPPYESGQFIGTNRSMTKRGSSAIRKTGYELMRVLKTHTEPKDGAVYRYILKKEAEGKPKKVAKMAGLNKFLRIYYARVMEIYNG
ncbi:MAG: IS110 family transposase [Eubacteriales bacterium]|jgi:transposase|nr:IS110 family transposase [Lachnospiraceae bacterium]MDO4978506.1 IS110 family transposase [Eubacteriales bacterium]